MEDPPEVVLNPLRRPLVAALALYVGDRGVGGELAQDALARALVNWPRVAAAANPGAYVYRIGFNLARSRFRRLAAERHAHVRLAGRRATVAVDGPETASPTALAVRQAVEALPPRYRQVVACRFLADLSVADTALAMRCAEGTVKSLTAKALAQLPGAGLEELVLDG